MSARCDQLGNIRKQAATLCGTTVQDVMRAERVKKNAPDLFEKMKAGEMSLDQASAVLALQADAPQRGVEVPLHEKVVLDYREVQALGICAERTLRRLFKSGKVVRAVIRTGARVKFEKAVLLEELREGA